MSDETLGALVLAAGQGTRMHSRRPKVLLELLGEPMLRYVLAVLEPLFGDRVWIVVGHGAEEVRAAFPELPDGRWILQAQQLGTGHALQTAWPALRRAGLDRVAVVNGDTPLIPPAALEGFLSRAGRECADLAFLTVTLADPGAFGRVVRDSLGRPVGIVEAKDWDEARGPAPGEVNAGIYDLRLDAVEPLLGRLSTDNRSGEYYITDLVDLAVRDGCALLAECAGDAPEMLGVNSPWELAQAEDQMAARMARRWAAAGVLVRNPDAVRIGPGVVIEAGAQLTGPCELYGGTVVGQEAVVLSHTWIRDSRLASGCLVKPFCHLEGAQVGPGCVVGPYARLRPGAVLEEASRVGNFVEVKQAVLGRGAKASHLTYLGDAEVGADSNIGAGTITCNYDGRRKHRTVIGEGAFIGSNTALVAPVTVGAGALVGAGSVITKDVPDGMLAVARERQRNLARKDKP